MEKVKVSSSEVDQDVVMRSDVYQRFGDMDKESILNQFVKVLAEVKLRVSKKDKSSIFYSAVISMAPGLTPVVKLDQSEFYLLKKDCGINAITENFKINAYVRYLKGHNDEKDMDYYYYEIVLSKHVIKRVFFESSQVTQIIVCELPIAFISKPSIGDEIIQSQFFE